MASPMSPFSLSLPDMKAIWPESLPFSMSSQSCDDMPRVRFGLGAGPGFTVHVPSLITACQVPPWSPLMSYWMVAFRPAALSARNLVGISSKVSFTVGMAGPPLGTLALEGEQVHSAGDREHGPGDVPGALRAEERDGIRDVLGLPLLLHGDALDHPLVHRRQVRVRADDARRDHVAGHVVACALKRDRLGEPDHAHLTRRVGRLPEAAHQPGDRGHADDPAPLPLAHAREHGLRHVVR